MTHLGHKLTALRKGKGWTQQQMSDKSGISAMEISHYECGRRVPGIANLQKLHVALDCSWENLLQPKFPQ